MDFKESDLYQPVCKFFTELGYDVQAEVNSCDLVAKRDGEIIAAELKKSFCLKLVYQAIDRQSMTDFVYMVIPRPSKGAKGSGWNDMLRLAKRLNLGIITVALDSPLKTVDVVAVPENNSARKNYTRKAALSRETDSRNLRTNIGGINKTKILTAYREKSIFVLCLTEKYGQITQATVNKLLNEPYAGNIISRNFYGWFEKISKGLYSVSAAGKAVLDGDEYKDAVDFYRKKAAESD